jgi:hypothetical protein
MIKPPTPLQKAPKNFYTPGAIKVTYLLAFLLMIGWAVGFFGFHAGNEIHLLLAMAMVTVLVNIIRGE